MVWTLWAAAALASIGPAPGAADPPGPLLGISEIKIGALDHDTPGLWSGFNLERRSVDANVEMLFSPLARTFGGYLRPAIGATFNFNGDTSKAYADLRWEIETPSRVFFALGMGAAIHDGELTAVDPNRKALGSRVLFHPSAELGWRFDGVNSISIFADHISNGFTRRDNEGMDTVGVRFGHRFAPFAAPEPTSVAIADFSGFYVGAAAGYQVEQADWLATQPPSRDRTGDFAAAGFAGYNWQSGRGVFGLEADASWLRGNLSAICAGPAIACQMDMRGLYSVRPRFGWVIDRTMIYGTGGLAIALWDNAAVNTVTGQRLGQLSATNFGVAVGAGIEHKFTPSLAARAEIMHYGLPGLDLTIQGIGGATDQFQTTVGRIGFTWYFH